MRYRGSDHPGPLGPGAASETGDCRGGGDLLTALSGLRIGPSALHLDLTLAQWAADGLLAVFFFVAGLELKREFVAGDLRDPRQVALPVAAAVGGMVAPALIYLGVNAGFSDGALTGWAIRVILFPLAPLW